MLHIAVLEKKIQLFDAALDSQCFNVGDANNLGRTALSTAPTSLTNDIRSRQVMKVKTMTDITWFILQKIIMLDYPSLKRNYFSGVDIAPNH